MRINVTDKLDEILRLWVPGIEVFYAAHKPDMWIKSVDDFEAMFQHGDPDTTIQALAVLEYRRRKMIELFREFSELTQAEAPTGNATIRAILENMYAATSENDKRRRLVCDECDTTAELVGGMRIYHVEETNNAGDPVSRFRTICEKCQEGRWVA